MSTNHANSPVAEWQDRTGHENAALEITNDRDQLVTGEELAQVCRAWDVYAAAFGITDPSGPQTQSVLIDFELSFYGVFPTLADLANEWVWNGDQQEHDLEDGPSIEDEIVVIQTADGYAAFRTSSLPVVAGEAGA